MAGNGSLLYALTWSDWDMPAGPPICRLRASGRRTSDSDCGGWPTPNSRENGGGDYTDPNKALKRKEHRHQFNLSEAALLAGWPSPMAGTPAQHGYNEAGEHGQREEDGRAGRGVAKPSNAEWRPGAGWQNGTQIGDCGGMGLPDGEGRDASGLENFAGPVEVDETYFGGREANKHAKKKKRLGRGGVGKAVIAGAKDRATKPRERAKVVDATDARTLQRFVADYAAPSATGAIAAGDARTNPVRGAAARSPRSNTRREHDRAF